MVDFLAELKRRHIYRIGAAYAVVAWVVLQLANNLAPALRLPDWALTLVVVLLVIGFPIALIFAWTMELNRPSSADITAPNAPVDYVLAAALVAVIGIFIYQQANTRAGSVRQANAPVITAPSDISIAVLPLVNLSGDAAQEFFSDGMTEEITAALTKVPGLRVLGRTSAFEFKGKNQDLRTIGQALGATHLIEGSVRKAGNRVRITAQLVKADDDSHLWAENYDRDLTDIFAIQDEIAKAIAASLRVPLGLAQGETIVTSRTKDEATYEDYLRAKALVRSRRTGALGQLVDVTKLLESVIAREPMFASAYALLAYTYIVMPTYEPAYLNGDTEQARPLLADWLQKAENAANRAVELEPKNADSYVALASVEYARGRYVGASDHFEQAFALDPGNPDGLHVYSGMLADLGYLSGALRQRERLQSLEPLVPVYQVVTSRILLSTGQADAALAVLGRVDSPFAIAPIYAFQGRYTAAADMLSSSPVSGQRDRIDAAAQVLRDAPSTAISPEMLPRLGIYFFPYAYVGAAGRALDWPEGNLKIGYRGGAAIVVLWGRDFASVRKTDRFKKFARDAGLYEFWHAKGFPDLCRPLGFDDFVCD